MGVAGLWEVLRPAGQVRSVTELAVQDGFNANPSHQRGFRVGIDASIWFFHAAYGREGENPELRTLFFRCCRLLQSPLLPLFVFDGPNRPAVKRGKRVGGNAHWLTQGMKNIIDAFGFEWRVAPGEAEAELAYLNRIGIIDAVLSDDVDNFLFGATMVIRNPSNTLSGNRAHPIKNAQGKDDGNHVVTYTADAILSNPSVALSRSGTILIGLLSGGDYIPAGLPGCGQKFATGLARAGFGDSLVKAATEFKGAELDAFLHQWRQDIRNELKTNRSGLLPTKKPSLAASLPDDFPSLPVLLSYADPITSENTSRKGNHRTPPGMWRNDPDPMKIASLCELYFEWGVKDVIVHRFRTVLWPGIVCRAVRRAVVEEDTRRRPPWDRACQPGGEEEDNAIAGPSSPTMQLSSTFSSISLSSPSKKASPLDASISDPSTSESFMLSSLVPLASPRPTSPSSGVPGASPLLLEIVSQRTHASTDLTLEYRILVDPTTLVKRTESGVKGLRPPLIGGLFGIDTEDENEDGGILDHGTDESHSDDADDVERLETAADAASKSGTKKRKAHRVVPTTPLRLWVPACMIRAAAPTLTQPYDEKVRAREEKKAKRGTKAGRGRHAGTGVKSTSRRTKAKGNTDDCDDESVPRPSTSKTGVRSRIKAKTARAGVGGGRRKPKQASEAQDDAYEYIDLSAGESPCSSDGESVEENRKGKGKEEGRAVQTKVAKSTAKASAKGKATTNTMKEHFNTTKPSTMAATRSKSSTLQSRAPARDPIASRRLLEEGEDSMDARPLSRSSRPLDLLRAKRNAGTAAPNPNSGSYSKFTVPSYREEESSSSSLSTRPSGFKDRTSRLPSQSTQPGSQATRKKPLFVDVSDTDTDTDIEVSDIRRQLYGTIATANTRAEGKGNTGVMDDDMSASVRVDRTWSTTASESNLGTAVNNMIDLTMNGGALRSKSTPSTSMTTASHPQARPVPAPLGTGTVCPTSNIGSTSKLGHILLSRTGSESEEEKGSEGDELPTFHRDSHKPAIVRPAPQPFPMQLAFESPISRRPSRLAEKSWATLDDEHNPEDLLEIVDVFTTPRGPSPPRSPTPSPSPIGAPPVTFAKSRQSNKSPIIPTKSMSEVDITLPKITKQRRRSPSDSDTPVSGNERSRVLKSPRKSAAQSSPKHVSRSGDRASSPTPLPSYKSASDSTNVVLWTADVEGRNALEARRPHPEDSGSRQTHDGVGRKPRSSDASAIYISSGSEDEGVTVSVTHVTPDVKEAESNDECTDRDVDTWADTGMILSAPPSPAPASDGLVPIAPTAEAVLPRPVRASKFKPASSTASKVDGRQPSADFRASAETTSPKGVTNGQDTTVPCSMRRAPLLVARAKRCMNKENDIIDLTSD